MHPDRLRITSPKRIRRRQTGWEGFFPYYAGFPESFATTLLDSAALTEATVVWDPWNGSGTTTYAASRLGLPSIGSDINPVMVVVARARTLPFSEADSLKPLAADIVRNLRMADIHPDDPLSKWFHSEPAAAIRAIEGRIRKKLIGALSQTLSGTNFDRISSFAAAYYVALFSACRRLSARFRSSNPTWLREPTSPGDRAWASKECVVELFLANIHGLADALFESFREPHCFAPEVSSADILLGDTTTVEVPPESVDFILTSPPYCTRIDYTAATRIELAVLWPLLTIPPEELSRSMIGSTRVPKTDISIKSEWGPTCLEFIEQICNHPSKASQTYYLKTHKDYFDKMHRSLRSLHHGLRTGGAAILIVQDSYYKEIHNDLPQITTEMASSFGLVLRRRENFRVARSMAGINPHARIYRAATEAVEAVLCFVKD